MLINFPKLSSGVPVGIYKAVFSGMENVPPNLELGYKAALKFIFTITEEGEYMGKKVSRICGIANGTKAHLPNLLLGLMKVKPSVGNVDLAPFIGKAYMITMGEKRVESFSPLWS